MMMNNGMKILKNWKNMYNNKKLSCFVQETFVFCYQILKLQQSVEDVIEAWKNSQQDELKNTLEINDDRFVSEIIKSLKLFLTDDDEEELYQTYKNSETQWYRIMIEKYTDWDNDYIDSLKLKFQTRLNDENE